MKRRLLTLLLTLVFCVTSVAPGFVILLAVLMDRKKA